MHDSHTTLRPVSLPGDMALLQDIYVSTRWEELAPAPWSDDEKLAFLAQQFACQHTQYVERCTDAEFQVIQYRGEDAGRLYVRDAGDDIRIIDIALLPAWRNLGIGGHLLGTILGQAAQAGKSVSIHVEKTNPAMRLYQRLGFVKIADADVYDLMEWRKL